MLYLKKKEAFIMYSNSVTESGIPIVGIIIYFAVLGVFMIIGLLSYILTSFSYYTIAKRRQIPNPWVAWIPVAQNWTIGSIADDYDKRNGLNRKWRVVLLTLNLVQFAAIILFYIIMIVTTIVSVISADNNELTAEAILGMIIALYSSVIIIIIPAVAFNSCLLICIYKIFESTVPEKSLKYLLL